MFHLDQESLGWNKTLRQTSHEHFTIINLICFDKLLYLGEHDDVSTFEVRSWLLSIQALTSHQYKCGIQGPFKYHTRCHLLIEFVVVGFWLTILLENKHLLIPIQFGSNGQILCIGDTLYNNHVDLHTANSHSFTSSLLIHSPVHSFISDHVLIQSILTPDRRR